MGNIRLYGSTSGYTELAPPAVAPDGVLALPSGTGTIATEAFVTDDYLPIAGGKILQIVRATDTTARTTTSATFVDASISVTITPQKSTSAIVLIWSAEMSNTGAGGYIVVQITDNSDNQISGAISYIGSAGVTDFFSYSTVIGYNSPATTSATTYKGRFLRSVGGTAQLNGNANTVGQLYAIEVSA